MADNNELGMEYIQEEPKVSTTPSPKSSSSELGTEYIINEDPATADPQKRQGVLPVGVGEFRDSSKYDKGLVSGIDAETIRARNQGWVDEVGNIAARSVLTAGNQLISGIASSVDFEDYLNQDKEVGNAVARELQEELKAINAELPVYGGRTDDWSKREWWMEQAPGVIGSAGGFAALGGVWGKALQGLSRLGKGGSILQTVATATAMNQAEAIPSAMTVFDETYKASIEKGMSEEAALKEAANNAAYTVNINRLNLPLNITSTLSILKSARLSKAAIRQEALKRQAQEILKGGGSVASRLASESLQEGGEEMINHIAEQEGLRGKDNFDMDATFKDIFSKEGAQASVLGMVGGVAQTGAIELMTRMTANKDAQREILEKYNIQKNKLDQLDALSKANGLPTFKELVGKIKEQGKIQGELLDAEATGDTEKADLLRKQALASNAFEYFDLDSGDRYIDMLNSIKKDPNAEKELGKDYYKRVEDAISQVKEFEQIYESSREYTNKREVYQSQIAINNLEGQIDKVRGELTKAKAKYYKSVSMLEKNIGEDLTSGYESYEKKKQLPAYKELKKLLDREKELEEQYEKESKAYEQITSEEYQAKLNTTPAPPKAPIEKPVVTEEEKAAKKLVNDKAKEVNPKSSVDLSKPKKDKEVAFEPTDPRDVTDPYSKVDPNMSLGGETESKGGLMVRKKPTPEEGKAKIQELINNAPAQEGEMSLAELQAALGVDNIDPEAVQGKIDPNMTAKKEKKKKIEAKNDAIIEKAEAKTKLQEVAKVNGFIPSVVRQYERYTGGEKKGSIVYKDGKPVEGTETIAFDYKLLTDPNLNGEVILTLNKGKYEDIVINKEVNGKLVPISKLSFTGFEGDWQTVRNLFKTGNERIVSNIKGKRSTAKDMVQWGYRTPLTKFKELSSKYLPNGEIVIATSAGKDMSYSSDTIGEVNEGMMPIDYNGRNFLVIKGPDGRLFTTFLYDTKIADATIQGEKALDRVGKLIQGFTQTLKANPTPEEVESAQNQWDTFKKDKIDKYVNVARGSGEGTTFVKGKEFDLNLYFENGAWVYKLKKGNGTATPDWVVGTEHIMREIGERNFNVDYKRIKDPKYIDFIIANNLLTTGLNPTGPFADTQLDIDLVGLEEKKDTVDTYPQAIANIGTREEYNNYLSSIFPNSKVKGIVYHGSSQKIEEFKDNFDEKGFSYGIWFTDSLDYINQLGKSKDLSKVTPVIINAVDNEKVSEPLGYGVGQHWLLEQYDSIYGKDAGQTVNGNVYAVATKEQVHVLGSKKDIDGFKAWKQSLSIQAPELVPSDVIASVATEESPAIFTEQLAPVTDKNAERAARLAKKKPLGNQKLRSVKSNDWKVWNKEKEMGELSRMLGDIPTDIKSNIYDIYKTYGAHAHGLFTEGMIVLADDSEVGTSYHEAFHVVMNMYLTEDQYKNIINKERIGEETDLAVEERLSEQFREYKLTDGEIAPKGRLARFFEDVLYAIKKILGLVKARDLFYNINNGGFKNAPIKRSFKGTRTRLLPGMTPEEQQRRVKNLTFEVLTLIAEEKANDSILSITQDMLSPDYVEEILDAVHYHWSYNIEDSPARNRVLANWNGFKKLVVKNLGVYGLKVELDKEVELSDSEKEMLAKDSKESRIYENSFFETSMKDSLGIELKLYLATVPMTKWSGDPTKDVAAMKAGEFELAEDPDVEGAYEFIDYHEIYSYLSLHLHGLETLGDMIDVMYGLAKHRPELYKVIYDLENKNNITDDKGGVSYNNFANKFFTSFSNQYIDFITLSHRTTPGAHGQEGTKVYSVFDTNKRSLNRIIKDEWVEIAKDKKTTKEQREDIRSAYQQWYQRNKKHLIKRTMLGGNDITKEDRETAFSNAKKALEGLQPILKDMGISMSLDAMLMTHRSYLRRKMLGKTSWINGNYGSVKQLIDFYVDNGVLENDVKAEAGVGMAEGKILNTLSKFESYTRTDLSQGSFMNGMDKQVYAINMNTHASKHFNRLKKGLAFEYANLPFYQNSAIIKGLTEAVEEDEVNEWQTEFGIKMFDTIYDNDRGDAMDYSSLDPLTAISVRYNLFAARGKWGYFFPPTPADRSNVNPVALKKLDYTADFKLFDESGLLNKNTEFYKWLMGTLQDEHARILYAKDHLRDKSLSDPSLIKNYHVIKDRDKDGNSRTRVGNSVYFNLYPQLNTLLYTKMPITPQDVEANMDNILWDSEEVHEIISTMIANQIAGEKRKLVNVGLLNEDGSLQKDRTSLIHFENLEAKQLDNFLTNSIYATTELTKVLSDDMAFAKPLEFIEDDIATFNQETQLKDLNKRFGESFVPGKDLSTPYQEEGTHAGFTTRKAFNLAIVKDVEGASPILDVLKESLKKAVPGITDEEVNKRLGKYTKVSATDAQGFCTLDRYREIMVGQGQFTKQYREAWMRLKKGGSDAGDIATVFQPIKGFSFGKQIIDGVSVPTQLKYSVVPLIPAFINGNPKLKAMHERMLRSKTDELVFDTGIKKGQRYTNSLEGEGDYMNIEILNEDYRIPQVVPYKEKASANFGSQIRKLITANNALSENDKMAYQEAIKRNLEAGMEKVLPMVTNKKQVVELILNQLESNTTSTLPDMYEKAMEIMEDGNTRMPMDYPLIKRKLENILLSTFDKRAIDQKMPGMSAVQVASVYMDSLKFTHIDKNGVVQPADVIISPQYFINALAKKGVDHLQFFKNGKLDIELIRRAGLDKMVVYRIPTQGKNSMLPCRIKDFTLLEQGSVIYLPSEITVQAGSDFDIDKVYVEMYNFAAGENGIMKTPSEMDSVEGRQNLILDLHYKVLTTPKNFSELITPNGTEVLSEVLEEIPTGEEEEAYWNSLWVQEDFREKNKAGKDLVGVYSIQNTAHSVAQDIRLSTTVPILFNGIEGVIEEDEYVEKVNGEPWNPKSLHKIKNIYGKLISDDLSERQSAAVDNAKEPILGMLNDNLFTTGFTSLVVRAGYGNRIPSKVTTQPIIKDLSQVYFQLRNSGSEESALEGAIEFVNGKYGIELTKGEWATRPPLSLTEEHLDKNFVQPDPQMNKNILWSFLYHRRIGESLSRISNAMSIDTKGIQSTMAENIVNLRNLHNAKNNTDFEFDMDAWNNHSLSTYERNVRLAVESLSKADGYFSDGTVAFREAVDTIEELANEIGRDLPADIINNVLVDFYTYVFTHESSPMSQITNSEKERLLKGENSLARKIKRYKDKMGENANPFIKELSFVLNANGLDFVNFNNTKSKALTGDEKNYLSDSLLTMYQKGTVEERDIAEDLFLYSFALNGFRRTPDGFSEYIPIEMHEDQNMVRFYRDMKKGFNVGGRFDMRRFRRQFVQNNFGKLSFIKQGNKFPTGEERPTFFYKRGKEKGLYELMGGEYKYIPFLGSSTIKEYDMKGDRISVLPQNAPTPPKKDTGARIEQTTTVIQDDPSKDNWDDENELANYGLVKDPTTGKIVDEQSLSSPSPKKSPFGKPGMDEEQLAAYQQHQSELTKEQICKK